MKRRHPDKGVVVKAGESQSETAIGPSGGGGAGLQSGLQKPEWDEQDLADLHRMIPDLDAVLTWNPLSQVAFRAGLLACRETMARFVEQGGSEIEKKIAGSIRANWWPSLGEDPGPPRRLHYCEVADEKPDGRIDHKPMSPNVEALPRAFNFIESREEMRREPLGADRGKQSEAQAAAARIVEMIIADGKPGPGGVDITGGIPSEVYVRIGRGGYDDQYEAADASAESVRGGLVMWIRREFGLEAGAKGGPA